MQLHLRHADGREIVDVGGTGDDLALRREGREPETATIVDRGPGWIVLEIDGDRHRVRYWREGPVLHLHLRGEVLRLELEDPDQENGTLAGDDSPILRAPMPGKVLEVLVREGDEVSAGAPLVRMEAMKMELDLSAPVDGVVEAILVAAGDLVEPDAELVRLAARSGD